MVVSRRHEFDEQQLEGAAEHYGGLPLPAREATDLRSIAEYFFSIGTL